MIFQTLSITKMKLILIIATLCLHGFGSEAAPPLAQQCSTAVQQLISCLNFANGGTPEPTKECCTSVSNMKEKQPVCLCFFIGQAHNGSAEVKSLGIQEAKLLQLPSACQLANASASNCPKLLGISPSSPAASIFMNNGTSATSPSSSMTTSPGTNAGGIKHGHGVLSISLVGFVSVLLSVLPFPTLV